MSRDSWLTAIAMQATNKSAPAANASGRKNNNEPRVSGEAFKRVDAEVWSKEIISGLEDNSCMSLHVLFKSPLGVAVILIMSSPFLPSYLQT